MAAAQSASQVKTEFLSTVSHEIRTPINAVLGFNEMVLRESRDEEITRYSENIRSAGKTLLAMISDMMDFTEMETGSFRIEETNYSAASCFLISPLSRDTMQTKKISSCGLISHRIFPGRSMETAFA